MPSDSQSSPPGREEDRQIDGVGDRSKKELWLETGAVIAIAVVPNLYGSISALIWPEESAIAAPFAQIEIDYLVSSSVVVAIVLYVMHQSPDPWSTFGLRRPGILDPFIGVGALTMAYIVWLTAISVGTSLSILPDQSSSSIDENSYPSLVAGYALFLASMALTVFSEELVMRAYLIPRFERLFGSTVLSIVLTTSLFVSYHMYQGAEGVVFAASSGLVLGVTFCLFRNIWPVFFAHLIHNVVFASG